MMDMDASNGILRPGAASPPSNPRPTYLQPSHKGNARVLLSSATSASTRSAFGGRGAVVSAKSAGAARMSARTANRIAMSRVEGNGESHIAQRGFTVEKCQDTGTGLSEVVKTGG